MNAMTMTDALRSLPAFDALLNTSEAAYLVTQYGRQAVVEAIRTTLADCRTRIRQGEDIPYSPYALLAQTQAVLEQQFQPSLRPVINATGVIIHTNLGRAPLSDAAQVAIQQAAAQ